MHIDDTLPGTDDREFLGGMTGTGKTTFIMKQLEAKKKENQTHSLLSSTGENSGSLKRYSLKTELISRELLNMKQAFQLR